jgi:hypothetical protein
MVRWFPMKPERLNSSRGLVLNQSASLTLEMIDLDFPYNEAESNPSRDVQNTQDVTYFFWRKPCSCTIHRKTNWTLLTCFIRPRNAQRNRLSCRKPPSIFEFLKPLGAGRLTILVIRDTTGGAPNSIIEKPHHFVDNLALQTNSQLIYQVFYPK